MGSNKFSFYSNHKKYSHQIEMNGNHSPYSEDKKCISMFAISMDSKSVTRKKKKVTQKFEGASETLLFFMRSNPRSKTASLTSITN